MTFARNFSDVETTLTDKRTQLMEAALELFAEKGFDGTSIRDIAQAADANVAMISYYFGSKEKLLEAIFERNFMAVQLEQLRQDTARSPLEKLDVLIDTYVSKISRHRAFNKMMMRQQSKVKEGPLFELIMRLKNRNHAIIADLIAEGQQRGVFRPDADLTFLMAMLLGTTHHLLFNAHFRQEPIADEEAYLKKNLKSILKLYLVHEK